MGDDDDDELDDDDPELRTDLARVEQLLIRHLLLPSLLEDLARAKRRRSDA